MRLACTGHRPQKCGGFNIPNPIYDYVTGKMRETIKKLDPDEAISGMALGSDQWFAQICVELKIPFTAAVPFAGQEMMWPRVSQNAYYTLLNQASKIETICEGKYAPYKMQIRNQWMVDRCDALLAVWDGSPDGGTANCVTYATKLGKTVYRIDPSAFTA